MKYVARILALLVGLTALVWLFLGPAEAGELAPFCRCRFPCVVAEGPDLCEREPDGGCMSPAPETCAAENRRRAETRAKRERWIACIGACYDARVVADPAVVLYLCVIGCGGRP